jgi:hypothetical protein
LDENGTNFFEIQFVNGNYKIINIESDFVITDSLIYPILNSNDFILTTLLNRSSAEFLLLQNNLVTKKSTLTREWENPIIGLVGAFNDHGSLLRFVENRYTLSLITNEDSIDLPVYRDSSFTGQNFSETLSPILSDNRPSVYINSTLIFGERLYIMKSMDHALVRPISLSVAIPKNCVPLSPEILTETTSYNFTFLCIDSNRNVLLKFLPMK